MERVTACGVAALCGGLAPGLASAHELTDEGLRFSGYREGGSSFASGSAETMRFTSAKETGVAKAAPPALLRAGEILGQRYRIEHCLGGGGMASVYRATHIGLDQPVAVKIVAAEIRERPGIVSRFMREARAATRLKGEHVVRVFDVGTADDGAPYLVMELLEGKDLAQLLDDGLALTVEEAIDYVLQTCEALAEVHGLGIVHRDLKPANLFVTRAPDGLPCLKLIDFGISRVDSPLSPREDMVITNPDVIMGSPRYMPPEQIESAAAASVRSDIWGLGAIFYELLVGSAPYDGDSIWDIYAAAMRSPPPRPSSCREGIPKGLDDIVLQCLRLDPADRFADVAELAAALAPFGAETAAARTESILRVHEACRARTSGDLELVPDGGVVRSTKSRVRRRAPHDPEIAGWRIAAFTGVALFLVCVGLAARPPARATGPASNAPRATAPGNAPPPSAPEPPSTSPAPVEAPPAPKSSPAPEGTPEATSPRSIEPTPVSSRTSRAPSPPKRTPAPVRARAPEPPVRPRTIYVPPDPTPPPGPSMSHADDRTFFEERK
jgi:serine/threonine-protein kinase